MTSHRLMLLAATYALGCSGRSSNAKPEADSAAMATMPGMTASDSEPAIALSAAQVSHGGVRWEPAGAGSAAASGATLPGQIVPNEDRTARLGAPAQGRVLAVQVSPGDRVRRGQALVTLQSPAAAMAQSDVSKAASAVTAKRAQATFARSARERADRLLALKAIPRQDYEKAVADEQLASSELAQAESELQRSRMTAAALGAGAAATGEIVLRSPQDGVVLERSALPGAVVDAGAPLAVVTDPSHLWLTMSAPETAIGAIKTGSSLRFAVPAYPADTFSARVTAVGAGLDPDTRTLPIRAVVTDGTARLKPAMLAAVLLPGNATATAQSGVMLPADAVQLLRGKPVVFVVMPDGAGGGHFMARPVQTGGGAGGRITIVQGLATGSLVVVRGAFAVKAAIEKGKMPKMEM